MGIATYSCNRCGHERVFEWPSSQKKPTEVERDCPDCGESTLYSYVSGSVRRGEPL